VGRPFPRKRSVDLALPMVMTTVHPPFESLRRRIARRLDAHDQLCVNRFLCSVSGGKLSRVVRLWRATGGGQPA
jgi:hypothetical protein